MSGRLADEATTARRIGGRRANRPPVGVRRVGYLVAVLINAALLWLLHVWPGWEGVPFLTADFADVLWLVGLSLWVGVGANLLYLVLDPLWLTALGGLATTAIGLAAALRLWEVFPFDLDGAWTTVVRVALVIGIVGAAIGILVNVVTAIRAAARGPDTPAS
jgi:hypothetical protein